jgi:hypothetical protein
MKSLSVFAVFIIALYCKSPAEKAAMQERSPEMLAILERSRQSQREARAEVERLHNLETGRFSSENRTSRPDNPLGSAKSGSTTNSGQEAPEQSEAAASTPAESEPEQNAMSAPSRAGSGSVGTAGSAQAGPGSASSPGNSDATRNNSKENNTTAKGQAGSKIQERNESGGMSQNSAQSAAPGEGSGKLGAGSPGEAFSQSNDGSSGDSENMPNKTGTARPREAGRSSKNGNTSLASGGDSSSGISEAMDPAQAGADEEPLPVPEKEGAGQEPENKGTNNRAAFSAGDSNSAAGQNARPASNQNASADRVAMAGAAAGREGQSEKPDAAEVSREERPATASSIEGNRQSGSSEKKSASRYSAESSAKNKRSEQESESVAIQGRQRDYAELKRRGRALSQPGSESQTAQSSIDQDSYEVFVTVFAGSRKEAQMKSKSDASRKAYNQLLQDRKGPRLSDQAQKDLRRYIESNGELVDLERRSEESWSARLRMDHDRLKTFMKRLK